MDIQSLVEGLHPLERKVLPFLSSCKTLSELVKKSGLQDVEAMRALQWLENKGALKINSVNVDLVEIGANGKIYAKKGLPERRMLNEVKDAPVSVDVLMNQLGKEEFGIALGMLKQKAAVNMINGKISITQPGKALLQKEMFEERFISKLSEGTLETASLSPEEKFAFDNLMKRKQIVEKKTDKIKEIELTEIGKRLTKIKLEKIDLIEILTPQILKSGEWKDKKFRKYDVKINVPKIFAGRKQEYRKFLDEVRTKFLALGFEEMNGPLVESEFWNMDALYMPQFHSARDIHDAYYVKEPKQAKIDPKILESVKNAHENGTAGSKGWGYRFDLEKTKKLILRTQGTACSARKLASKDFKVPGKYFGITRVFRPDVIDATHNADFFQTEGIVVGEKLNLRHLFGLLEMFAKEFAG
ncbi:phenylalanine--tRNA ligase subunit alpha, partial [Candidatus Woesearchaeota archaeon]|nr:phenylalanine--tRNA ligase subunit alpha [Candidatus Woesearchaeota archaeon]